MKTYKRCRDALKRTERLILEEGTRGILEAWTLFLWEAAENLADVEATLTEVETQLKQKDLQGEEILLDEIERQKALINQLEEALKEANSKLAEETSKFYEDGIKAGRKIAEVEEIGVFEELEILKTIEFMLQGGTENCNQQSNQIEEIKPCVFLLNEIAQ